MDPLRNYIFFLFFIISISTAVFITLGFIGIFLGRGGRSCRRWSRSGWRRGRWSCCGGRRRGCKTGMC